MNEQDFHFLGRAGRVMIGLHVAVLWPNMQREVGGVGGGEGQREDQGALMTQESWDTRNLLILASEVEICLKRCCGLIGKTSLASIEYYCLDVHDQINLISNLFYENRSKILNHSVYVQLAFFLNKEVKDRKIIIIKNILRGEKSS